MIIANSVGVFADATFNYSYDNYNSLYALNQLFTKVASKHLFVDEFPAPQYLLNNKTDVFVIELVERYKEILTGNIYPDFYK